MNRRNVLCLLIPAVFAMLNGCASMTPTIESVAVRIVDIDLEGVDLCFDVGVKNALPLPIKGPSGSYGIDIAGATFVESDNVPPLDLPARDVGTVTLPARVEYRQLWQMYQNLGDARQVAYTLRGTLTCPVAGKTFELPFSHEGDLPILRPPKLSVVDVRTSDISFRSAKVAVEVQMTNPNIFALGIKDLGYALKLGEIDAGQIKAATADEIAAGGTGTLTLSCEIRAASALAKLARGTGLGTPTLDAIGKIQTPYGAVDLAR